MAITKCTRWLICTFRGCSCLSKKKKKKKKKRKKKEASLGIMASRAYFISHSHSDWLKFLVAFTQLPLIFGRQRHTKRTYGQSWEEPIIWRNLTLLLLKSPQSRLVLPTFHGPGGLNTSILLEGFHFTHQRWIFLPIDGPFGTKRLKSTISCSSGLSRVGRQVKCFLIFLLS